MASTPLFRFRLTTATRLPGLLRLDAKETSLTLPDGHTVFIVARHGESLASANKLHFEAGCYNSQEEAKAAGERLRLLLRLLNASLALGLNVPIGDRVSCGLTKAKKDEVSRRFGVEVMNNVWGLLVFPDDERHVEFMMHGELDVSPSNSLYWLDGISQLWGSEITLDDGSEDALELLGLASLEPSPRSAFLVTYLALERLLTPKKRSKAALSLLKRLQNWVFKAARRKHQPITNGDKDSLVGSLRRLRYESVGNSLARLAAANEGKSVEGTPITKFVKKCTKTRHATAHPGKLAVPPDYSLLARGLRTIAMGVLWNKHGIRDLTVHIPPSRVHPGGLQARVIAYKQR